jgi:hypothetical protein
VVSTDNLYEEEMNISPGTSKKTKASDGVGGIDEKEEEGDQWQDHVEEEMIHRFEGYEISDDDISEDDISEIDEEEGEVDAPLEDPRAEDDEESRMRSTLLAEALGLSSDQLLPQSKVTPTLAKPDESGTSVSTVKTPIPDRVYVLPLFAMLSPEQQRLVFQPPPPGHRLIVVATNVAETSITIPGIRYVVDCGRQKERIVDIKSGINKYQVSS